MAHINIKPAERSRIYETADQAINHLFVYGVTQQEFDYGGQAWGRTIEERRAVIKALASREQSAFKASKRRGYWRVEVANG